MNDKCYSIKIEKTRVLCKDCTMFSKGSIKYGVHKCYLRIEDHVQGSHIKSFDPYEKNKDGKCKDFNKKKIHWFLKLLGIGKDCGCHVSRM